MKKESMLGLELSLMKYYAYKAPAASVRQKSEKEFRNWQGLRLS